MDQINIDENVIKRKPPHRVEAEKSIIGSMLIDKDALIYAVEHIKKDDFYIGQYGLLFEVLSELNNESKEIDSVTIIDRLKEKNAPAEICEGAYLAELADYVPSSVNIKQYCKIVSDRALDRRLIKTCEELANKAYAGSEKTNDLLEMATKGIYDLAQRRNDDELVPISKVVMDTLDIISKASKKAGQVTGVPSGFTQLDYMTAGFQPSNLILIAARPAMGKTAFVLNIAEYAAFRKNYHVAIFSLEMSKEELTKRLISMESNVDSKLLRTGNLSDKEWDRVVESGGIIGKSNLMIYDTPGITISELRSRCRRMQIEHGLDMVIIDYLQLMSGGGKSSESRQQEISEISRSLKVMARELNVPVIALSQLSRAVEQRPDHRPMLSDLRESGAIEQDADMVMFIYRDDYYNEDSPKRGIADIIIAKQRSGSIGSVELVWLPDYTKFGNKEIKKE